jgi:hypothetical protein
VVSSGTLSRSAGKVEDRFSDTRGPGSIKDLISIRGAVGVAVDDVRVGS